jgi:hypothetical protein
MTDITAYKYLRDGGPTQRTTGYVTFTTAASDTITYPSSGGVAIGNTIESLASGVLTLTFGFIPRSFRCINLTSRIMTEWFYPMTSGTSIDTAAAGTRTLNTSAPFTISQRTGAGGSSSQAGGSADTTTGGVVTLTLSGFATNADTIFWEAHD